MEYVCKRATCVHFRVLVGMTTVNVMECSVLIKSFAIEARKSAFGAQHDTQEMNGIEIFVFTGKKKKKKNYIL